jgi:hypothetical protein
MNDSTTIEKQMRDDKPYPPEEQEPWYPEARTRKRRKRKATSDGLPDVAAVAVRLNVTKEKVRTFARDGELKFINVGHGEKRPRYRFTDSDIAELIEKRRQQETLQCPSLKPKSPHPISGTGSKSIVVGFMEARAARLARKPKK